MNKYFKIAMFITSFLPLWITVIFIDILSILKENANLYTEIIGVLSIGISIGISICIIKGSMKKLKTIDYKAYNIIDAVQEKGITSEFLLSYMLPLFAFNFTEWDSIIQFLVYFITLAFLCIRNNNVYANLLFEFKNYKFYSCELVWASEAETKPIQAIVISNINMCANKGNTVEIATLNKPFYIIKDSKE